MQILILGLIFIILTFGFVIVWGAPYLPTLRPQTEAALDLLDLKSGQTMLELGAGDGTVAIAAGRRGIKVVAYELNPLLAVIAKIRTSHHQNVRIIWGNFWTAQWPDTDGIYVFLLDRFMQKLDKKIIQTYSGKNIKLASHAFKIPGKEHAQEKSGVFLYRY